MSAYIGVLEVRGQMPGTTRGGASTKSVIDNTHASGYVTKPVARRSPGIRALTDGASAQPNLHRAGGSICSTTVVTGVTTLLRFVQIHSIPNKYLL